MDKLKEDLKTQIIEQLNLEEVSPSEITNDMLLFGDGLGLDSIDALELIVLLEQYHGVRIANPEDGKKIFESVNSMAEYINQVKQGA
jgi:acyl carrier protein